jgi:hypothetical protein
VRTVSLRVAGLSAAEASAVASASLVAKAESTAGIVPAIAIGVDGAEAEAPSVRSPCGGGVNVVLGVLFVLLCLLKTAVGLRVLVHRPIAGIDGAIAELAAGLQRNLGLHTLVRVGGHTGWEVLYLSAAHGCCWSCRLVRC